MKRLITILSAVSIALISCQQNLVPDEQEITASADEVMTRTYSTGKVTPDDPVIFLPATNMKAWTDIESLEDRFEACKVSETRLSNMTTEALVKSMMNYPLNYLVFVYNDPKMAQKMCHIAGEMGLPMVIMDAKRSSEDFAWFTSRVPGILFRYGIHCPEAGCTAPAHRPDFQIHEPAMANAVLAFVNFVLEWGREPV